MTKLNIVLSVIIVAGTIMYSMSHTRLMETEELLYEALAIAEECYNVDLTRCMSEAAKLKK